MNKRDNLIKWTIISIFVGLYAMVSCISTIHVIDFFRLSNPNWLAITLAIAFEVGAAASLAAIVILDRTSRGLVWTLFFLITGMQMMGNMYYAYTHLSEFRNWSELFGMIEEDPMFQKRVLSIVSGAILPIVALGFIKSLVDYIRPSTASDLKAEFDEKLAIKEELKREKILEEPKVEEVKSDTPIEESEPEVIEEEVIEEPKEEITIQQEDLQEIQPETQEEKAEKEKVRKTEEKLAKIIAKNPEIKKQIEEKLREYEDEDKYTKSTEEIPQEAEVIAPPRVIRSGM